MRDGEELGRFGGGRVESVGAGLDTGDRLDGESVCCEQQAEFAWGVATGPQVDRSGVAGLGSDLGDLVRHAGRRVELGVVVVLHGEVGVEGAQREPSAGPQCLCHPGDDRVVLAVGRHHSERALTQADHRIEFAVERHGPRIHPLERGKR